MKAKDIFIKNKDFSMEAADSLFAMALKASENSYAPYSNFHVGAALLTAEGEVYTGVNVENASYGATVCAERTAVFSAVAAGKRKFAAIAVASPDGKAYPCGMCRQVLSEFGKDIKIIVGLDAESIEITDVAEMLPKGFEL